MRTRRDILAQILVAGSATVVPFGAAVAAVFRESAARENLRVLTTDQSAFLARLADIIIPPTDTAAASEVGVVKFIDGMLADWYGADESRAYLEGLELCRVVAGPAPATEYVAKLDAAAFAGDRPSDALSQFYRTSKELVMVGYFTSRQGMQDNLHTLGPIGHFSFEPSGPPGNDVRY